MHPTALLGLSKPPTRASFFAAALAHDIFHCAPPLPLRVSTTTSRSPSTSALRSRPSSPMLRGSGVYGAYMPLLERAVPSRLMSHLGDYASMRIALITELATPLDEAASIPEASITEGKKKKASHTFNPEAVKLYVAVAVAFGLHLQGPAGRRYPAQRRRAGAHAPAGCAQQQWSAAAHCVLLTGHTSPAGSPPPAEQVARGCPRRRGTPLR
ncbi:hypothetical protein K438DRAFT_712852 [Mycena galopus ATCC 62051]|nr:hypothetical protein K438DRAFT_712852 [Mycena galopus ATCC 62051]